VSRKRPWELAVPHASLANRLQINGAGRLGIKRLKAEPEWAVVQRKLPRAGVTLLLWEARPCGARRKSARRLFPGPDATNGGSGVGEAYRSTKAAWYAAGRTKIRHLLMASSAPPTSDRSFVVAASPATQDEAETATARAMAAVASEQAMQHAEAERRGRGRLARLTAAWRGE